LRSTLIKPKKDYLFLFFNSRNFLSELWRV